MLLFIPFFHLKRSNKTKTMFHVNILIYGGTIWNYFQVDIHRVVQFENCRWVVTMPLPSLQKVVRLIRHTQCGNVPGITHVLRNAITSMSLNLPHKVKTQYLHFRSHAEYSLLSWKISEVISRRSILFHN